MKRRIIAVLLAFAVAFSSLCMLTACGDDENYPVNVAGVVLEKRPETIVCLSNKYTQVIVDIGYATMLDGRPGNCELPEVQSATPCGTAENPSTDAIINLGTDLLIVGTDTPIEALQLLADAGVTVLQLVEPISRTAYLNLYRCIGTAMNGNGQGYDDGEAAAQHILIQLDDIERKVMGQQILNVCIYTDSSLNKCITGDMFASLLIEMAGGFNVAIECTDGYCDMDTIERSDPDIILCPEGVDFVVRSQRDLEDCSALLNNRIYVYDLSKFDSIGNDLVLATWELARLFFPDVVAASDLPAGAIDYMPNYDDVVISPDEYEEWLQQQEQSEQADAGTEE